MAKAVKAWGQMNVKTIGHGEIEDFLHAVKSAILILKGAVKGELEATK
jgi:hypothetical protein